MSLARRPVSAVATEPIAPDEVRAELARVLASAGFRSAPRRRELLRYLVEEMLAGRGDLLKGYSIATSVFGRGEDFDPQTDPVVRLEARRLRLDLADYYVGVGRDDPLRIEIPKGHYAPDFLRQRVDPPPAGDAAGSEDAGGGEAGAVAPPRRRAAIAALVAVLALGLAAAVAVVASLGGRDADRAIATRQPAVMVAPFAARGDAAESEPLASGIADQVLTELTRFPDFRLYLPSRGLAQAADDPLAAGRNGGVPYVVSGSVTSDAQNVRVSAQLIEVDTGRVLWADEYVRQLSPASLLTLQTEIAAAIATALGQPYGVIKTELTSRIAPKATPSLPSFDCVLRAYAYRRNFDRTEHAPLLACLQAAVERDPDYADAWAMLGWLQLDAFRFGIVPAAEGAASLARAKTAATQATALDGRNIVALKALASIEHYLGNFAESQRLQRAALALNPNDPDTLAQLGWRLAVRGDFAEGIPYLQRAIDRTVNPPGWYFHLIAIDDYLNGRYAEMLAGARRGAADGSGVSWSLVAIAEAALGDGEAAKAALRRMVEVAPAMARDPAASFRMHQATPEIVNALMAGLGKAGWTSPAGG